MPALLVLLQGCTSPASRRAGGLINAADTLMDSRPDSALALLDGIASDTARMSRGHLMRYYLLRTNALNKLDTVFSADHTALMRRVCDHYDHGGSPNDRMLAHYLLGRCYADMGEAPAALYEFNNAVEAADTTSAHCDFKTLLRVHSQRAFIFYLQDLYDLQLSELYDVISNSKKVRDFLSEMWARESVATVLEAKGRRKEALKVLENVHRKLLQHGYREEAARSCGVALAIQVDLGHYDDIGSRLYEYEHYSGLFDTAGNIVPSKALYYVYKGKYLLCCGKADSAVMMFRKCLQADHSLETRLAGAMELESFYGEVNAVDSTIKYARLSSRLNDSIRRETRTTALSQQENSRKYNNLQAQADQLRVKNEQTKRHRQLLLFTLIVILLLVGYVGIGWDLRIKSLKREKEEKRKEVERINQAYLAILERHEDALTVLQLLKEEKEENADAIKRYQEDVEERNRNLAELSSEVMSLKKQLKEAEGKISQHEERLTIEQVDSVLAHLDTVRIISECLSTMPQRRLSLVELRHIREEFREKYPSFYQQLVVEYKLPLKKYDLCLLYRLNIKPASIATLLGVGRSSVTMERHRIYESIFGRYDEDGEFEAFLRHIV